MPAVVQLDGVLVGLPDEHRTCVYRIVQEALTNRVATPMLKAFGYRCMAAQMSSI